MSGALCLVAEDDHDGLWWTEVTAFLDQVTAWFDQAHAGWPEDRPDLDLDRYFHQSDDTRLYLYDDLAPYSNGFIRFRPARNNTMHIGRGTAPSKSAKGSKHRFGFLANIGDVEVPPRAWADIAERIDPNINLDRRIRRREVTVVMLTYRRGPHKGIIALEVWPTTDGGIAARRLRSAADTDAARSARAGLLAPELHRHHVAVVGVGALGSFIADMLARSGVHRLTLVDHDIVEPGNVVRHLVGPDTVGLAKVEAVRRHIAARGQLQGGGIAVINNALASDDSAAELMQDHSLVINATADFATTALLHLTAEALNTHILSAALQNDGATYRIDVLPALGGADPLPPSDTGAASAHQPLFESGCGSPISPTPPHAVIEAAAATVRHAIGLLVEQPLHPAGEVHHYTLHERTQQ
ncbi:ThiF family adenylyltransferase [Mycobacterium heidelbergense]|uniref:ThiF family adenylyltransferase n=1 Tax=Mycobacterium heidelbergense TaxID=53376 RepID=UPI001E2CD619|nr:ThiF family adenylyltransferase [Mycobacterium heidelbergense]